MPPPKIDKSASSRKSPVITRHLNKFLKNFSDKPETMAESVVKHEVITTVTDLPRYSGEPNTIDLHQYINRIENYLFNKGIQDDKQKIEVFKQHIDASKGTARHVILFSLFKTIKSYDEYIKAFKRHFTKQSEQDPVRAVVKCVNLNIGLTESQTEFMSRLDSCTEELVRTFEGTDWTVPGQPSNISLHNMGKLIMLTHILKVNKGVNAERLHKDINSKVTLAEVDCLIKKYSETNTNPHVMSLQASPRSPQPQRQSRMQQRIGDRSHTRQRSSSRPSNSVECFRGRKTGHISTQCYLSKICNNCQYRGHQEIHCRNPSWCIYHQTVGHRTQDCRTRRSKNFQLGPDTQVEPT